jgi:AcrR family transcriptional regulator
MSPRKYEMNKRAAAVQETRGRIVAATVAAHRDLGIQATSWDEVARRAGVGVGTVYRHFRSLDQLLPACGEQVDQTLALPAPQDIPGLFDGARSTRVRIERLVGTVFRIYERGAPFIENIRRERKDLPELEHWHLQIEATLDALAGEALRPLSLTRRAGNVVRAMIDLSTWHAFTQRGLSTDEAIQTVSRLIECSLRSRREVRASA